MRSENQSQEQEEQQEQHLEPTFRAERFHLGYSNGVLVDESNRTMISYYLPGYLITQILEIQEVDIKKRLISFKMMIHLTIHYGELPYLLIKSFIKKIQIIIGSKKTIPLKQTHEDDLRISFFNNEDKKSCYFDVMCYANFQIKSLELCGCGCDFSSFFQPFKKLPCHLDIKVKPVKVMEKEFDKVFNPNDSDIVQYKEFIKNIEGTDKCRSRCFNFYVNLMTYCDNFSLESKSRELFLQSRVSQQKKIPQQIQNVLQQLYNISTVFSQITIPDANISQQYKIVPNDLKFTLQKKVRDIKGKRPVKFNKELKRNNLKIRLKQNNQRSELQKYDPLKQYLTYQRQSKYSFQRRFPQEITQWNLKPIGSRIIEDNMEIVKFKISDSKYGVQCPNLIVATIAKDQKNQYGELKDVIKFEYVDSQKPSNSKLVQLISKDGYNIAEQINFLQDLSKIGDEEIFDRVSFDQVHLELHLIRNPGIPLAIIAVPLLLTSMVNLLIFFTEPTVNRRLSIFATYVVALAAFFPTFRSQISPHRYLRLIQILVYIEILGSSLAFIDTDFNNNTTPRAEQIWENKFFLASFSITMINIAIVLMLYVLYLIMYCCFWRKKRQDIIKERYEAFRQKMNEKKSNQNRILPQSYERGSNRRLNQENVEISQTVLPEYQREHFLFLEPQFYWWNNYLCDEHFSGNENIKTLNDFTYEKSVKLQKQLLEMLKEKGL